MRPARHQSPQPHSPRPLRQAQERSTQQPDFGTTIAFRYSQETIVALYIGRKLRREDKINSLIERLVNASSQYSYPTVRWLNTVESGHRPRCNIWGQCGVRKEFCTRGRIWTTGANLILIPFHNIVDTRQPTAVCKALARLSQFVDLRLMRYFTSKTITWALCASPVGFWSPKMVSMLRFSNHLEAYVESQFSQLLGSWELSTTRRHVHVDL
ncbi:hypothetical protein BDV10DRAFT_151969 [Aspergillus recurvatus]